MAFFVRKYPSKAEFDKHAEELYTKIGDSKSGIELKKLVTKKMEDPKWNTGLNDQELANLAHKMNYGPLYHAIAKRVSGSTRQKEFPQIAKYYESADHSKLLDILTIAKERPLSDDEFKEAQAILSKSITEAPVAVGVTTTANVAAYPVPLGSEAPGKKKKKQGV